MGPSLFLSGVARRWYPQTNLTKSAEARRYKRAQLKKGLAVAWRSGAQRELSRADSVAVGGFFIRTANPPPVGASVQLAFRLPDGDVSARAIVRHSVPGKGMGIEFVGMNESARGHLQAAVKRLLKAIDQLHGKK